MNKGGSWTITFSDMLTLLLTFFVFIIGVSVFKTPEYKEFWRRYELNQRHSHPRTASSSIHLINGLKAPFVSRETESLLSDMEQTFARNALDGVNIYSEENKITLSISEDLGFEGGSVELTETVQPLLKKFAASIQRSPFDVTVEGHTDSQMSPGIDNMNLSLQRALTTARALIRDGIKKERISVSGYGPYRPVATNDTAEGRQLNRRVEISIIMNNV
ncbi:MAG: flagellar motor protein MotB [Candidatus Omnitrophota bacterium]